MCKEFNANSILYTHTQQNNRKRICFIIYYCNVYMNHKLINFSMINIERKASAVNFCLAA